MRLAAAEPEPAPLVSIAHVAHAVIEDIARRADDLGERGRFGPIEILPRHDRPRDDELADLAVRDEQVV